MDKINTKAQRLVIAGDVTVESWTAEEGVVTTATGTVQGDTGLWHVTIDGPQSATCDCPYGSSRENGHGHSHDLALLLAAREEAMEGPR